MFEIGLNRQTEREREREREREIHILKRICAQIRSDTEIDHVPCMMLMYDLKKKRSHRFKNFCMSTAQPLFPLPLFFKLELTDMCL